MAPMASTVSRVDASTDLREAVGAFAAAQRRMRSRDAKGGGMSFAQWHLLRRLTPASVTQMLDHLAELGLVERVRSHVDRRVVLNRLTPAGREHFERKQAEIEQRWQDALSDLSASQLGQAAQVLRRMVEVLDSF
jgi:DNA-binding MarR family transcriptional regulator